MPLKLIKKSGYYHVVLTTMQGKRTTLTTKQTTREKARQTVKDANLENIQRAAQTGAMNQGAIGMLMAGRKVTMEQAVEAWLAWLASVGQAPRSIEASAVYSKALLRYAGIAKKPPSAITEKDLTGWVNETSSVKLSSRQGRLSMIRKLFQYCSAKGWCVGNPGILVRVDMSKLSHTQKEVTRREVFSDEEIKQLLKQNPPGTFWHVAVALGRYTGLRIGDICCLEWECFDKPGRISVWTGKRDVRVDLPLTPLTLVEAVASIPINRLLYCFPEEREKFLKPSTRNYFSIRFRNLLKKLGITDKTFHCLRHTYATRCHEAGIPTPHIANFMGHASTVTTEGYIHETEES